MNGEFYNEILDKIEKRFDFEGRTEDEKRRGYAVIKKFLEEIYFDKGVDNND